MTEQDTPSPLIIQHTLAMQKAMDEVQKYTSSQQMNDALSTWNRFYTASMHDLPINSPVLMYHERITSQLREWKEPYNLVNIQGKSVIIELSHGLVKSRIILIKPFFIDSKSIEHQQPVPNSSALMKERTSIEVPQREVPLADILSTRISSTKVLSALSVLIACLTQVKQGRGHLKKDIKQANIAALLDISFLTVNCDVFNNANDNEKSAQYIALRQKKVTK